MLPLPEYSQNNHYILDFKENFQSAIKRLA